MTLHEEMHRLKASLATTVGELGKIRQELKSTEGIQKKPSNGVYSLSLSLSLSLSVLYTRLNSCLQRDNKRYNFPQNRPLPVMLFGFNPVRPNAPASCRRSLFEFVSIVVASSEGPPPTAPTYADVC